MNTLSLSNGAVIPCLGYGCYKAYGEELTNAVRLALESGYTYFDSAEMYKNEKDVGAALKEFSGERRDLFILSKAWPSSYDRLEEACAASMSDLGVEYLDAYLMHWPGTDETRRLKTWEKMLQLAEKGMIRTPGVSNFQIDQLEKIREEFGAYPAINEIECHPSYRQPEMVRWCREHGIQIIAYQPINRQIDLSIPAVQQLAEKYARTPAQIILRWHVQHDQLPIPKSCTASRIRENISVFDFSLTPEDMAAIDQADTGIRAGKDPFSFPEGY